MVRTVPLATNWQSYSATFTKIAKKEARLRFLYAEGIFVNVFGLGEGGNFQNKW
jgi:hypothetical protein